MEMTIDEAIKEMELEFNLFLKDNDLTTPDLINDMRESDKDFDKVYTANTMALDIMRKYQQIQEVYKKWFCEDTSAEAYTKISEILKDKEPITKKGHWVIGTCVFYCSECGYEPYNLSDFCPGCGADMREEEEV